MRCSSPSGARASRRPRRCGSACARAACVSKASPMPARSSDYGMTGARPGRPVHPTWQAERPVHRGHWPDPHRSRGAERRDRARSALRPTPAPICEGREPTRGAVGLPQADTHRSRPRLRFAPAPAPGSGPKLPTNTGHTRQQIPVQPRSTHTSSDPLWSAGAHLAHCAESLGRRGIRGSAVSVAIASGSLAASAPADRAYEVSARRGGKYRRRGKAGQLIRAA